MSESDQELAATTYIVTAITGVGTNSAYPNNVFYNLTSNPPSAPRQFLIDTSNPAAFVNIREILNSFYFSKPASGTLTVTTTGVLVDGAYSCITGAVIA
ncbi:hypothetical protein [Burkholderia ubonensis]|uniref:hypothetical protein n=1 Tax=Burkholderia ubonensis TaxID=101571 RepID=UPI0011606DCA|nr:hypothetical protein [Burkholderia ubonensis]